MMLVYLVVNALRVKGESQSSVFNIEIPNSLHKANGYKHKEAMFGSPTYNKLLSQRLYYSNTTLCGDAVVASGGLPPGNWETPHLLMVDRGECTFVNKVRNAQNLGASAVVVADNKCLCDDTQCDGYMDWDCEVNEPIMADDGSGSDITIPAILMWKSDADEIKQYLKCGDQEKDECDASTPPKLYIQAQLEYALPAPDDRVEWSLWTTSIDAPSEQFLIDFKSTALALGQSQFFTPHYYTYNGTDFGCRYSDRCGTLCTNNGRYCAPDPDGSYSSGIDGADVVRENLRRTCLWKLYGGKSLDESDPAYGVGPVWWNYVSNFSDLCGTLESFTSTKCINNALLAAGASISNVEKCIADSGGADSDGGPNTILDTELKTKAANNIYMIPECIVNTKPIWGALNTANVLNSICQGFSTGDQPQACSCQDLAFASEEYNKCLSMARSSLYPTDATTTTTSKKTTTPNNLPWWGVFLLIVAVICLMLLGGLIYWKKTQQQMRDQVRGILAEYMPLEDLGPAQPPTTNAMHSLSIQA